MPIALEAFLEESNVLGSMSSEEITNVLLSYIGLKPNTDFNFLNPNRIGLFDMSSLGVQMPTTHPLLSSLIVDLSQRNFVQGLTIKALAQI